MNRLEKRIRAKENYLKALRGLLGKSPVVKRDVKIDMNFLNVELEALYNLRGSEYDE